MTDIIDDELETTTLDDLDDVDPGRGDALDEIRSRFEAHGLTFTASRDDVGVFFGECPRHRRHQIRVDFDPADDRMYVHSAPCGCLPGETIRQLGLGERAAPFVPVSIRTDLARRRLGVRTALSHVDGAEGYERMINALEAAGLAGTRGDPEAIRGEGRYQCPACGAPGDGHGLRVKRRENGTPGFDCYACKSEGYEILIALGLSWADVGRISKVDEWIDSLPDGWPPRQAADEPGEPEPVDLDDEAFWGARPKLTYIRDFARSRRAGPWAVLGSALAQICARVGPHVVLPPTVGTIASLNTFWAMVARSGGGKDIAMGVAGELFSPLDGIPMYEVGTGQGIDAAYTEHVQKVGPVQYCDAALFTITEIDTLAGHAAMSGSTTMATLRKVYSGSALGAMYADRTKRRPVPAHRYRAAVIAGVQPARSGVLLNDADGGTPQRWIWLPTSDPNRPKPPVPVDEPNGDIWTRYEFLAAFGSTGGGEPVGYKRQVIVQVCDTAKAEIVAASDARLDESLATDDDGLNSHSLLTRLKVATLLALLERGEAKVLDDDWELSDYVMRVSNATRAICTKTLASAVKKANVAKAEREVERAVIVADRAEARVARALARTLRRHPDWIASAKLKKTLSSDDRKFFDPAVERLRRSGQIEEEESARGTKYRWPVDA